MAAIFFGSISTLADTSELQRAAFDDAFAQHGLDWSWSREDSPFFHGHASNIDMALSVALAERR